ncbi:hypothetical protein CANCADRAFT_30588 [Tortispora caseinolytica NRRL Y-17796]|uniref:Transcription initiation factor IIA large subunit n=1 Tax=Tortispora caseinolytica NRRL Y-17796 TaxID=767744 RepID=A0A1E4TKY4_9ASCO|nr:hypothetical protein CANCADRAFT_30588 [Tortispora caseinolytica NRRL Y-17796]
MSHQLVGSLYRKVIDDVINESRLDFEEAGIDEGTLRELQTLWQQRMSALRVARFPWDPVPENTTVIADGDLFESGGDVGLAGDTDLAANRAMAAMRAARQIQKYAQDSDQKLGTSSADQSIRGIMKQSGLGEEESGSGLVLPGGGKTTQVDGTYDGIDERGGFVNIELSGGIKLQRASDFPERYERIRKNIQSQLDGANTGSDDSDAINSDLDDSEDELGSQDEENEENSNIMLCLYDKVQRTKNKWKCSFREGIISIEGRDYVFSRANGEYEW